MKNKRIQSIKKTISRNKPKAFLFLALLITISLIIIPTFSFTKENTFLTAFFILLTTIRSYLIIIGIIIAVLLIIPKTRHKTIKHLENKWN